MRLLLRFLFRADCASQLYLIVNYLISSLSSQFCGKIVSGWNGFALLRKIRQTVNRLLIGWSILDAFHYGRKMARVHAAKLKFRTCWQIVKTGMI